MHSSLLLVFAFLVASAWSHLFSHAGSLRYYEYIESSSIEVYPSGQPQKRLKKKQLQFSSNPEEDDSFLLSFDAYNQTFSIFLQPAGLLHPNATFKVGEDAEENEPLRGRMYTGKVLSAAYQNGVELPETENFGKTDRNWAAFILHDETFRAKSKRSATARTTLPAYEGVFSVNNEVYTVQLVSAYRKHKRSVDLSIPVSDTAKMIIHRGSDRETVSDDTKSSYKCGSDQLDFNSDPPASFAKRLDIEALSGDRKKSSALFKRVFSGCPTAKKIIYVGIVMDCNYISKHGSAANARNQVLKNFLYVSAVYEAQFNIQVGIIDIVAMDTCQNVDFNKPCADSYTIQQRLSDFSNWRSSKNDDAGLWHLYSTCPSLPVIGLAWMNMVCRSQVYSQQRQDGSTQYVSGTAVTAISNTMNNDMEWLVTAHEIGHNFGAKHDCTSDSTCPTTSCCKCSSNTACSCSQSNIMSPTANVDVLEFSGCSQEEVCSKSGTLGTCFQDPGSKTVVSIAQCGNGIVENDEQCDCGGASGCANSTCCDTTCKLKSGAVCDDKSDACCKNCQLAPKDLNLECRPARGQCDTKEYCDGTSKNCPKDLFLPDGTTCSLNGTANGTVCASGQCTNRNMQCIIRAQSDGSSSNNLDTIEGECPTLFKGQCYLIYGICTNGVCSDPDKIGEIIQWAVDNPGPTAAIGAGIAILLLVGLVRCCRGSKRHKIPPKNHRHHEEEEIVRSGRMSR
ncbi:Metallo-peptidase family M12-domain-containing protein [Paraphysoderma sedebokerense]|nr:Metallo-peptidase family M12-domain-containing protein [Paraphysoderma sedebokerense]